MKNKLSHITDTVCRDYFRIKAEETVLVIANPETEPFTVAQAFYNSALKLTSHVVMLVQQSRTNKETMDEFVSKIIALNPDVVISSSRHSLGRDPIGRKQNYMLGPASYDNILYYLKAAKKLRAIWFYVYSVKRFISACQLDLKSYLSLSKKLVSAFNAACSVHVYSESGCDLTLDISDPNRKPEADFDGNLYEPGKGVNLPFGEVYVCPVNGSASGTAIIDGSFHYGTTTLLKHPVKLEFANGLLKEISGKDKKAVAILKQMVSDGENCSTYVSPEKLALYKHNARTIGEFAVGINPKAKVVGEMIEDEKTYGTCHIALGASYNGDPAMFHSDMVIKNPTVTLNFPDGRSKVILKAKKFHL